MIRQAPAGGEGVRRRLARAKGQRMSEGETERQNLYHVMEEVGPCHSSPFLSSGGSTLESLMLVQP